MNKRGFTLIEIIICLVLIVGIGTASIIVVVKNNNDNDKIEEITKKIVDAANIYINIEKDGNGNTYQYGILNGGKGVYISLETLVDKGYIKQTYLDEIKKTGDTSLQLLAVNAKGTDGDAPCVDGDITYQVSWEKDNNGMYLCPYSNDSNHVNLTYDLNYDNIKYEFKVKRGTNIPIFNQSREGYIFTGWISNNLPFTGGIATSDITLIAGWNEKEQEQNNITKLLKYKDSSALYNKLVYGNWTTDCNGSDKTALCFGYSENLSDYDEPIIYYKGAVENNYLKIDGLNTVFRIARTVENGGVKIIEDETIQTDIEYSQIKVLPKGCFYFPDDIIIETIRGGRLSKTNKIICMKNLEEIKHIYVDVRSGAFGRGEVSTVYTWSNISNKYNGWGDDTLIPITIDMDDYNSNDRFLTDDQIINIGNPIKTAIYDKLNENYQSKSSIMNEYIDENYRWCIYEFGSEELDKAFKCNGEQTLNSKFGLLTYDEYDMLTLRNGTNSRMVNNLYGNNIGIYIGEYGEFTMNLRLTYYLVNSGLCDGCETNKKQYLRPAYVLKGNSKVIKGTGTSSDPFIIDGLTN